MSVGIPTLALYSATDVREMGSTGALPKVMLAEGECADKAKVRAVLSRYFKGDTFRDAMAKGITCLVYIYGENCKACEKIGPHFEHCRSIFKVWTQLSWFLQTYL